MRGFLVVLMMGSFLVGLVGGFLANSLTIFLVGMIGSGLMGGLFRIIDQLDYVSKSLLHIANEAPKN